MLGSWIISSSVSQEISSLIRFLLPYLVAAAASSAFVLFLPFFLGQAVSFAVAADTASQ